MISKYKCFFIGIVLLAVCTINIHAVNSGYLGYWQNVDCNTQGITNFYLNKGLDNKSLGIHIFVSCQPRDCDWGHTPLYVYGTSPSDKNHQQATAHYITDNTITILTLQFMSDGNIFLNVYTRFVDNSNRENYHSYGIFKKVSNETETMVPQCPDLIVEKIVPYNYRKGDKSITVTATIKNIGSTRSGPSSARLTDKTNEIKSREFYTVVENVNPLNPGESTTIRFTIEYKAKFNPDITVEVEADYKRMVDECNENNNTKIITN